MHFFYVYILIGILSGISTGIIGLGSGIITLPLLLYVGMNIRTAVGCVLLMQLIPNSIIGVSLYHNKGFIDYYSSLLVILGSLLGIGMGSYFVTQGYISEEMTYKVLTVSLIIISIIFTKKYLL
jgi:uncharacterized membrane protein YfcA